MDHLIVNCQRLNSSIFTVEHEQIDWISACEKLALQVDAESNLITTVAEIIDKDILRIIYRK